MGPEQGNRLGELVARAPPTEFRVVEVVREVAVFDHPFLTGLNAKARLEAADVDIF